MEEKVVLSDEALLKADPSTLSPEDQYRKKMLMKKINRARIEALRLKNNPELAARRAESVRRMHEALARKKEMKKAVQRKVDLGMPITDEERDLLMWTPGRNKTKDVKMREEDTIAAASKLLMRPQNVKELRALVERTAAKHHYNPIEALILMTKDGKLDPEDVAGIHKALLPYLAPQLKVAAPKEESEGDASGVRVFITRFEFPPDQSSASPLYQHKPATVTITDEQSPPAPPAAG